MGVFQVRIHGRGGQGVVTAAELLSMAAFAGGRHAQAFPSFGSERMGAPIVAFCRIADAPIRTREPIEEPDALIIQDPTLLHSVDVFSGLGTVGYALINSSRRIDELGLDDRTIHCPGIRVLTVPATDLARDHVGRPTPNAVLLGAFAAMTGVVSLDAISAALHERFPAAIANANQAGAQAAHAFVEREFAMTKEPVRA
jgi:pyruvate ferredoxin oxidoreductase gamma subunit